MPPIHPNKMQTTTKIQKKNLKKGLNVPALIIVFFIIYGNNINIIIDNAIAIKPNNLSGIDLKIA